MKTYGNVVHLEEDVNEKNRTDTTECRRPEDSKTELMAMPSIPGRKCKARRKSSNS